MAAFEDFVQNVIETNLNFRYQQVKNLGALVFSDLLIVVTSIEICKQFFLDKKSQSLWNVQPNMSYFVHFFFENGTKLNMLSVFIHLYPTSPMALKHGLSTG